MAALKISGATPPVHASRMKAICASAPSTLLAVADEVIE